MQAINLILISSLLGYIALTALAPRMAPYSRRPAYIAAGAGCLAGSLFLSIATHTALPTLAGVSLMLAGSCCLAVFNALLLVMWGERWSTLAAGDVGRQLCISFAFAFALYFCMLSIPTVPAILLNASLASLSALALAVSQQLPCRTESFAPVVFKLRPTAAILASVLVFSVVFGCMQYYMHGFGSLFVIQPRSMLIAGILIALFALAMTLFSKAGDPFSFHRPIVPAIACGILVSIMLPPDIAYVGNGIVIAGVYCLDMFIMFSASDLAYRAKLPVALIFGAAITVARAGTWAGTLLGSWVVSDLPPFGEHLPTSTAMLILACAVVITGSLVFTETHLRVIYQPEAKPRVPNLDERCEQIAQSAGLSARELDVMRLLARGRSVAVISETLGIAQGTVKHHASNTYRKLGVYDRQGLIDIVMGEAEE